jgi:hypothetical protein
MFLASGPSQFSVTTKVKLKVSHRPVVVKYVLDDWGSISGRDRNFSVLQRFLTGHAAQPASYPVGTGRYAAGTWS